jgi:positive regulator of sigma E activity
VDLDDDGADIVVETGVVVRVVPAAAGRCPQVVVRVEAGPSCENCGAGGHCQAAAEDSREVEADDLLGCAVGDRVRLEVPGGQVLRLSFQLYGVPLLLLLAGVGLGSVLIPAGPWRDPGSFLLAVGLATAAFPLVRLITRCRGKNDPAWRARVVERL